MRQLMRHFWGGFQGVRKSRVVRLGRKKEITHYKPIAPVALTKLDTYTLKCLTTLRINSAATATMPTVK
jgi:hypothetical protein